MTEDSALLHEYAANRTESAFAELVRRHVDLVYSAAMRRTGGDTHQAQDIVQFVFNDLARKAGAVARHPTLAGWLHTATRNAAINAARSERRRRFYEKEASMNEPVPSIPAEAEWERLRPVLDEVIDHLPQPDHDAVVLRFLEGRPFADIGHALRISEDAARMRVDRALEKLRRLLARRGVTSTALALSLGLAGQTAMAAPGGMATSVTGTALAHAAAPANPGIAAALWKAATGTKLALAATGAIMVATGAVVMAAYAQLTGPAQSAASLPLPSPAKPGLKSHPAISLASLAAQTESPVNRTSVSPRDVARQEVTRNQRARMLRNYAPIFAHQALAPAQRERLITLLVDEFEVAADFAAAASASGIDATADAASFNVSVRQLREGIWNEIRALLGDEGYAEYLAVRQDLRAESWVTALRKKLGAGVAPLTPGQEEQLRALLKQAGRDPKHLTTLDEAGRFLSPSQLAVFREFQSDRIAGWQSPQVQAATRDATAQNP